VITGVVGLVLGGMYLASPTWRLAVVVDDDALAIAAGATPKFRLAWADVEQVLVVPAHKTCFVDGGAPTRSFLVPGEGAPAPYAVEDARALYDAIVARVDPKRVREVESLTRSAAGRTG
jgi:hypothetical protein